MRDRSRVAGGMPSYPSAAAATMWSLQEAADGTFRYVRSLGRVARFLKSESPMLLAHAVRPLAAASAVVFAIGGIALTAKGIHAQPGLPPPAYAATIPATSLATTPPGTAAPQPAVAARPRSVPVSLSIPRIKVQTKVVPIDLRPDKTLDVPPIRADAPAGWYDQSATPGELGGSVIVGHVDSAHSGPAVFYRLRELHPGDRLTVHRTDGSTLTFTVTSITLYTKAAFPTAQVYAPRNYPELTLITCGGTFDRTHHTYLSNLVVTTRLT